MTTLIQTLTVLREKADARWRGLYLAGGIAGFIQIAGLITAMVIAIGLGPEPTTAQEYFDLLANDRLVGILRMDFITIGYVSLYAVTSFAVWAALRERDPVYPSFAVALVFTGLILGLANNANFSLLYLNERYVAATGEAQKAQFLAAGEALIASHWWHTTGGFLAGIFMQGGATLLSYLMLKSGYFGKVSAWSGMLSNGLDCLHVPVMLIAPGLANAILAVSGVFYLLWFPSLAIDLLRVARKCKD